MERINRIGIIGGGAAGMMAALFAKDIDNEVILIEKNNKLGKKIYITGKGRCNITNESDIDNHIKNCIRNPRFMYTPFFSLDPYSTIDLFNNLGLKTKLERGNRVFPVSDKASDVVRVLEDRLKYIGVDIRLNTNVVDIIVDDNLIVKTKDDILYFDKLIIACGGASYPSTGSDASFFKIIKKLGHKVTDLLPSLVPFITKENVKELSGLTLNNVELTIENQNIKLFGDLLFTHKGISGPIVLQASALIKKDTKFPLKVSINLKPAISKEVLDKRLIREFELNNNKNIYNVMKNILPQKLIEPILDRVNIDKYKKVNEIDKNIRKNLVEAIRAYKLTIVNTSGFNEAVITRGGVDTKEIDPHTMQSKLVKNLYFAGEVIDIDSMTGGYNLQLAWSTGYLAGLSVK